MGYSWGDESQLSLIEDYVLQACQQTRLHYHVHSERIYLIGVGEGASLAYRLGLTFPDKFAGVVSLNGAMPRHHRPLMRLPEVRSLKVFIGHGFANATIPLPLAREDYRLLYSAGASVQFNSYATNHRLHADMLRDVNRWVVNHCEQEILPIHRQLFNSDAVSSSFTPICLIVTQASIEASRARKFPFISFLRSCFGFRTRKRVVILRRHDRKVRPGYPDRLPQRNLLGDVVGDKMECKMIFFQKFFPNSN